MFSVRFEPTALSAVAPANPTVHSSILKETIKVPYTYILTILKFSLPVGLKKKRNVSVKKYYS